MPRVRPATAAILLFASAALAQAPEGGELRIGLWPLFRQSFDVFTIMLVAGSVAAVAVMFRCLVDIRERRILDARSLTRIRDMISTGQWDNLRTFAAYDESFPSRVLRSVLAHGAAQAGGPTRTALREAAELAASEECARWFRRIEPLNVIGNLGPLVGLAGTVWGMILAFVSLGRSGGQAGPADLSLGISKALFHTLLGLCLAIPCMLIFGIYRGRVDRICTRAMVLTAELVERLPVEPAREAAEAGA